MSGAGARQLLLKAPRQAALTVVEASQNKQSCLCYAECLFWLRLSKFLSSLTRGNLPTIASPLLFFNFLDSRLFLLLFLDIKTSYLFKERFDQ